MAEEKLQVAGISYVLYYVVLFFAHWFGANRFDMDGDGDFDPEDVQAYLAEKGFLKKNFRRSSAARKKNRERATAKVMQANEEKRATLRATMVAERRSSRRSARASATDAGEEQPPPDDDEDDEIDETEIDLAIDKEVPKLDDKAIEDMISGNLVVAQRKPWFMIFEVSVTLALWSAFAIMGPEPLQEKAGLDSLKEGYFDLRLFTNACEDLRMQAWRWWAYQWTHANAMHVLMNAAMNCILGIPLEGNEGALRMAIMYNVGVLGGAYNYMINDAHTIVVGCSGGVYSLIGIHFADLMLNWREKKFRIPTMVFLSTLVGADMLTYMLSLSPDNASHSAHVGGFVAGVLIGIIVGKNDVVRCWERFLIAAAWVIGLSLTGFCLWWMFSQEGGPRNIWESTDDLPGWCWWRQVWLPDVAEFEWLCIKCGTQSCIDEWSNVTQAIKPVVLAECKEKGWYFDGR